MEEIKSKREISKERSKYNSKDIKVFDNIEYLKDKKIKREKEIKILEIDLEKIVNKKENLEKNLNDLIDELNSNKNKKIIIEKDYNLKNKENLEIKNKIEILSNNLKDNVYLNNNVKKILDNPKLTGIKNAIINIIEVSPNYQKAFDVVSISNKNFIIAEDDYSIKCAIDYLKNNNLGRATFLPINIIKPNILI